MLTGGAPTVGELVAVVAGHGLPGGRRLGAAGPLPDAAWTELLAEARTQRLAGLLDRSIAAGEVPATAQQAAAAEAEAAQAARGCLALERDLLAAAGVLASAAVDFRVLKGAAVAHLDETDSGLRHYHDVDLLVRGRDLSRAVGALGSLGYTRDLPERRPGFDARFGKEVPLARRNGRELDLHRTLALGAFGLALDLDVVWATGDGFVLGGHRLVALGTEGRFVHACYNAMLGDPNPRLVALRDVARIATRHDLDMAGLDRLVPPGRGTGVVAAALDATRRGLGVDAGRVAERFPPGRATRWERTALRAYRAHGGSNTLELLSGTLGAAGRSRVDYLRALVLPGADYRRSRRAAGRPGEWRAGLMDLRRRRSVDDMERRQGG